MMIQLATLFLVLSGIATLTYQVSWVRLLGLSMGSTSASISTVLAAFFLGMALGSYMAERITRNRIHSFAPYIILEAVIGISGLALLPVLLNLDSLMAWSPALGTAMSFKFVVSLGLLLVPTICMGATFPVMAALIIRRQNEVGLRIGQLYSLNTAGAVLGAMLSGFVFIPMWGLDGAIYIAFSLNLIIVLLGMYSLRRLQLPPLEVTPTESSSTNPPGQGSKAIQDIKTQAPLRTLALVVLFCTGLVAIATEVGWTKYLSIFAGSTIYGFAAILTIFLTGIAVGSWVIKSYLEKIRSPALWMASGLLLLGFALLLTRAGLSGVPLIYDAMNHMETSATIRHLIKYTVVFFVLFIPTFLFGAIFPLNLKMYCGNLSGVRSRIGKAYAVNTMASIIGSIAAGFWLIPQFGTDVLLTVMAMIILFLPLLFLPALQRTLPRLAILVLTILAFLGSWGLPHINYQDLILASDYQYDDGSGTGGKPEFKFLKEGKAGVISIVTYDGVNMQLANNALNESTIDISNPNNRPIIETFLGLVPYLFHEDPKTSFIVGFGGGVTTDALTRTDLESIRVVELEPAVVEGVRTIYGGKIPALQDKRVRIEFNDARNTLLVEQQHYDLIVSQPSHPWRAGAANVFTQEFFEITRSRLNPGGIYGQWVNLFYMDATTLRALLQAFYTTYPYGFSMANLQTGDLLMFGSDKMMIADYSRIQQRLKLPRIKAYMDTIELKTPRDLFWYFALSREEALTAAAGMTPNTDTNILSEVRLAALDGNGVGDEDPYAFLRKNSQLDLIPYLKPKQAAQQLYDLGLYLLSYDDFDRARKAAKQLMTINPQLARALDHEVFWMTGDYEAALALYKQHKQWPGRTRQQQALILTELSRFTEAAKIVDRINDRKLRRVARARLLHAQGRWRTLADLEPQSEEERKWQLIGLAQQDLLRAGSTLSKLIPEGAYDIPQLQVVVRYLAAREDNQQMEIRARQLLAAIDYQVNRLSTFADNAVQKVNKKRAQILLQKIEALNPKAKKLSTLRKQVADLGPGPTSVASVTP